jgi:hypothetical protein
MTLKAYNVSIAGISETNLLTSGASGRDNYNIHGKGCGSVPGSMLEWICKWIPLLKIDPDTKYVHIKSTTVYAPRRNWDSPNPFLASECSPPPRNRGEGHTSLRVGGWWEFQFRRRAYTVVLFICTYFVDPDLDPT